MYSRYLAYLQYVTGLHLRYMNYPERQKNGTKEKVAQPADIAGGLYFIIQYGMIEPIFTAWSSNFQELNLFCCKLIS